MEDSYDANDEDFIKIKNIEEANEDENENEEQEDSEDIENNVTIYNKNDFTLDKVMKSFFKNEISQEFNSALNAVNK